MEGVIVILLLLLASVPISLIVLLVRVSALKRRVESLEYKIQRLSPATAPPETAPETLTALLESRNPVTSPEPAPAAATEPAITSFPPPALIQPPPILPREMLPKAPLEPMAPPPLTEKPVAAAGPRVVDWEKFLGVKLFAWVGGLALFLGVAFFVR